MLLWSYFALLAVTRSSSYSKLQMCDDVKRKWKVRPEYSLWRQTSGWSTAAEIRCLTLCLFLSGQQQIPPQEPCRQSPGRLRCPCQSSWRCWEPPDRTPTPGQHLWWSLRTDLFCQWLTASGWQVDLVSQREEKRAQVRGDDRKQTNKQWIAAHMNRLEPILFYFLQKWQQHILKKNITSYCRYQTAGKGKVSKKKSCKCK